MIDKANKLVSLVCTLKNDRKTDFVKGTITNFDAIVLFLYAQGHATAKDTQEFTRAWRGEDAPKHLLNSYFSPHGGCTGATFMGNHKLQAFVSSGAPKHPPLWYRSRLASKGVLYATALNLNGMARAKVLLETLRGMGKDV